MPTIMFQGDEKEKKIGNRIINQAFKLVLSVIEKFIEFIQHSQLLNVIFMLK